MHILQPRPAGKDRGDRGGPALEAAGVVRVLEVGDVESKLVAVGKPPDDLRAQRCADFAAGVQVGDPRPSEEPLQPPGHEKVHAGRPDPGCPRAEGAR